MSSLKIDITITLLYNDYLTRSYTFENVATEDLEAVKGKIQAINANSCGEYADFYKTFVSNDGASVVKIESCKIVTAVEEVIYDGK